jgi:hypothetical protein
MPLSDIANRRVTLITSAQAATSGNWTSVQEFAGWSIHVGGIATTTGQTVQIQVSNRPTVPTIGADEIVADSITADAVIVGVPVAWVKAEITAWAGTTTSGTISAYLWANDN